MPIKIQKVVIKDFKVIKDLEQDINGKSVFLIAENGRGKSSFMQAIQIALGNTDVIPDNMTGSAIVDVTKDGEPYTFSFKMGKKGKLELSVTMPNGLKEDNKGVIRGLVGSLSFDVNEFVAMSETTAGKKKQVEQYKSLLPKEFIDGLKDFETKVKNTYDERTTIGQKMSTLEGFIKESKLFGEDLKTKPVDVTLLSAELEKYNASNTKIKDVEKRNVERDLSIAAKKAKIEELKSEILEVERVCGAEEQVQKLSVDWLKTHVIQDVSGLLTRINSASDINVMAAQAEEHNKKLVQYNAFKETYGEFTVDIELNKQAISDAIKDFECPVKGLSFTDDELIYNGIPVSINSMSTSEIIHLGVQMKFASNPECGLMFIEHGESLGTQMQKDVLAYSKLYDIQLFVEEMRRGQDTLQINFINED